jgi:hypothetical protein
MGGPGSGRPRKIHPPAMVEEVRRLYFDHVMSQEEVALELGVSRRVIFKVMRNHGLQARPPAPRDQSGAKGNGWVGDNVTYTGCHNRVQAARGRPNMCSRCNTTDPSLRYEWANLTGHYSNVDDYARMCVSCHRRFDAERRAATGGRTSEWRRKAVSTSKEAFRPPV